MTRWVAFLALALLGPASPDAHAEVTITVTTALPPASTLALDELRAALAARPNQPDETSLILVSHAGPHLVRGLKGMTLPEAAESTAILDVSTPKLKKVMISGRDDRGLAYALRDAARAIAVAPPDKPWHEALTYGVEQPFLKVRNVSVHLFNADCEREWFFSEEFWRFYFQRLSLSRFNRCTLTFCDQTNYLCPPYAYLVEMPEYPSIKVADCTTEQRGQNLKMLRRIAELADEYAIDFDLGIWMQGPVAKWAAPVQVTGLPEGMKLAEYCALGLRRILEACPSIDGLQLRMNAEAGVPEEQQTAFYKPMFRTLAAVQSKQRPDAPYRLDLRYKGLTDETIRAARDEKLAVTVSTKFWAEHFGLPYHPTMVDSHYAKDRYSFGALLKKPRDYRVTYQLWTVGSQRLTLWGDPGYCIRFAQSCKLGDGEGFEVFAPLTNKGYGNKPGAWPVIKNPEYRVGRWEQERYWMFYLCFGRMGYNPETKYEVFHREFRHRFGKELASAAFNAYCCASEILPLITTQLLPSASEWYWWPEMDTGGDLREYARIQPSDPAVHAPIRAWEKTDKWRWEEWDVRDGRIPRRGDFQLDGRAPPAWNYLSEYADKLDRILSEQLDPTVARSKEYPDSPERRMTAVDFRLLSELAKFHSWKLHAAQFYAAFETTDRNRATANDAAEFFRPAVQHWRNIVRATDGVYHPNLVFGITPDMPRSKFGHHHSGHWKDRLAEMEDDLKRLEEQGRTAPESEVKSPTLAFFEGVQKDPSYAHHEPPAAVAAGKPLRLELVDESKTPEWRIKQAAVYVRPLDQTRPWRKLEMQRRGDKFIVDVPADAIDRHFDFQYYFYLVNPDEHVNTTWPYYYTYGQPYYVVPVEAK